MDDWRLDPGDVLPGEDPDKVARARARFRPRDVGRVEDFERLYGLLYDEFFAAGELERREVLEAWWRGPGDPVPGTAYRAGYHGLLVEDAGEVAAVRDGFSSVDPGSGAVVGLMSHSLVLPAWRRSGVAALLRAVPARQARAHAAAHGVAAPAVTLVAEMEPLDDRPATAIRLRAYLAAGFRVVDPGAVAYAQPDFGEPGPTPPRPVPLLLLVRRVGREAEGRMPAEEVVGIYDALRAIHGRFIAADALDEVRAVGLAGLGAEVGLLDPTPGDEASTAPLRRERLAGRYPAGWWR